MVMQTWKERRTGSGKKECPVCRPYLWDPGEVDPPASSRPREKIKFPNLLKLIILATYGIIQLQVLHGIQSPIHGSTNNNNTSIVLRPLSSKPRQCSSVLCKTMLLGLYQWQQTNLGLGVSQSFRRQTTNVSRSSMFSQLYPRSLVRIFGI